MSHEEMSQDEKEVPEDLEKDEKDVPEDLEKDEPEEPVDPASNPPDLQPAVCEPFDTERQVWCMFSISKIKRNGVFTAWGANCNRHWNVDDDNS